MSAVERDDRTQTPNVLLAAFCAQVQRVPQACAVRAPHATLTYAELAARSAHYAAALSAAGSVPDDVIAFSADRTPDTLALLLAIVACGAAYLPLDANQTPARLAAMLEDARPRLVIGSQALRSGVPTPATWIDRTQLASNRVVDRLDVKASGNLAYVLFTSGSTGRPKGVAMRSAAVAALLDWHLQHPRLGRPARTLQFAPLGFDVSFQEIFSTLASGGTLVLPSDAQRRDPWALLALLRREAVERVFLPCVALHAIAEAAREQLELVPATLSDVITAGERLRITPALRALFSALPECVLHNHYGPTETHVVTAHELRAPAVAWPELPPIGAPLPHVRIRLDARDPEHADEGELLLGGACLADGYIGRPELTAQRFIEISGTRWYRSGDRVRLRASGELDYLGRDDDQIKIAGQRVEPAEVEAVLSCHAQVAQVAVVADIGAVGAQLIAHVVPREAPEQDTTLIRALAQHCRAALPEYLQPQAFVLHPLLPTTSSGKVDRRALAHVRADAPLAWDATAPLQSQLLNLWRQLLASADLSPTANLFDAGARSLTVVRALTELRRHGHVLSVAQIYDHPSVAAQAALLAAEHVHAIDAAADAERGARQRAAFARFQSGAAG